MLRFEQGKFGVFKISAWLSLEWSDELASGLVDGLIQMLDDMKSVENDPCLRSLSTDHGHEGLPHVHGHRFELRGSLRP